MNITVLATYSFVIISLIATKKQPTLIKQKMPTRRVSNTSTSQRIRLFVLDRNESFYNPSLDEKISLGPEDQLIVLGES